MRRPRERGAPAGKRSIELDLKTAAGVETLSTSCVAPTCSSRTSGPASWVGSGSDTTRCRPRTLASSTARSPGSAVTTRVRRCEGGKASSPRRHRSTALPAASGPRADHRHRPVVHGDAAPVDVCRGDRCAYGRCCAARSRSVGRGQRVEVSLFDAAYEVFGHECRWRTTWPRACSSHRLGRGLGHYKCKDGRWLHLCLFEDRHMRWFARSSCRSGSPRCRRTRSAPS